MKELIKKERFCKIIRKIEQYRNKMDMIEKTFNEWEDDFSVHMPSLYMESEIVSLLELIFEDTPQDISYFIYELDFGKEYSEGCITEDGKNIDMSTPEKLYDYLKQRLIKEVCRKNAISYKDFLKSENAKKYTLTDEEIEYYNNLNNKENK